jgi:hypothetical protein
MAQVEAKVTFDQKEGLVVFRLDLQGNTELEHEILAAAIGNGRSVSIVPDHAGDELFAVFGIKDESIWQKATRALENRIRVRDGRPTVEEEEAQATMAEAARKDAEKREAEAKAAAEEEAEDKKAAEDKRLADAVAAGISKGMKMAGKAAPAEAPALPPASPAPETNKS